MNTPAFFHLFIYSIKACIIDYHWLKQYKTKEQL